jgi:hypothetical protein
MGYIKNKWESGRLSWRRVERSVPFYLRRDGRRSGGSLFGIEGGSITPFVYFLYSMSIISMVRVGRVQERPFGVLTMVLANLLLELNRVGGDRNKASGRINDSYGARQYVSARE